MANMGSRKHLKRFKSPNHWPIHPKEETWTIKPSSGPHSIEDSIPLMFIVRNILGFADNSREAKYIINNGNILIDGKPRKDHKFPVGFMDVIEIPKIEEAYRALTDDKGRFLLHEIKKENVKFKLCKITNKTILKGGKTQLNLHDGRNLITEEELSVDDVIKLNIPEQNIDSILKFQEGTIVLVTGGKHIGKIGNIKEIHTTKSSMSNTVIIESNNESFLTLRDYVFIIGQDDPIISLPGGK